MSTDGTPMPSWADWCASIDRSVEAEFARMKSIQAPALATPVVTTTNTTTPMREKWTFDLLAPKARTELRTALRKMPDHDICVLWALWKAIGPNYDGSTTPAEEFIHNIGLEYLLSLRPGGHGVTPQSIEMELKTFRDGFNDALAIAAHFNDKYRDVLNDRP